ncbi:hypothetical protein GJ496_003151 [Pomphorhynchus laevis]|nr:hypothetical protein GJ496_003151 [Pomphorhynchus laevis]
MEYDDTNSNSLKKNKSLPKRCYSCSSKCYRRDVVAYTRETDHGEQHIAGEFSQPKREKLSAVKMKNSEKPYGIKREPSSPMGDESEREKSPGIFDRLKKLGEPSHKDDHDIKKDDKFPPELEILLLKGYLVNDVSKEVLNLSTNEIQVDKNNVAQKLYQKLHSEFIKLEKAFCKQVNDCKSSKSKEKNDKYCLKKENLCFMNGRTKNELVDYSVSFLKLLIKDMESSNKYDPGKVSHGLIIQSIQNSIDRMAKQWPEGKKCEIVKVMQEVGKNMK